MKRRESITWNITKEQEGWTLLTFLRRILSLSYKEARLFLERGLCRVNRAVEQFGSRTLRKNDRLEIEKNWRDYTQPIHYDIPNILYEDDDCLILDKPVDMICEDKALHRFFLSSYSFVHRIDQRTSGAVIVAKNPKMQREMISLFRQQRIIKIYLAVVDGHLKRDRGKVENYLVKKNEHPPIWGSNKRGLYALTAWRCLHRIAHASIVLCHLITGRTHQLRVHFSEMGHPILGDYLYSKLFEYPLYIERPLLHSLYLEFDHPMSKKKIAIQAPIPKEFYHIAPTIVLPKPLTI